MWRKTYLVCSTFQNNLTSLTNQLNRNENLMKWGGGRGGGDGGSNGISTTSLRGDSLIYSAGLAGSKSNYVSNADINHNNNMNRKMGIPRLERGVMRPIKVIHETPYVYVASRNFCSGFECNEYLIVSKLTGQAVFVDACDDWPDDWASFITSAKIHPTHVFLTHCHIDNIVNLNALLYIVEQHAHIKMGLIWSYAEMDWVRAFPRACRRYGRNEEGSVRLPMEERCWYNTNYSEKFVEQLRRQQHFLANDSAPFNNQQKESWLNDSSEDGFGNSEHDTPNRRKKSNGSSNSSKYRHNMLSEEEEQQEELEEEEEEKRRKRRSDNQRKTRENDILLSCATNRSTSFFELGAHTLFFYIHTPGHSPGHMMLNLPRERFLFTGDVLSYNQIGRVDLPWACGETLAESLLALEDFPDNTVLLPGHGRLTTLGRERRENKALRSLYERISIGKQEVSVGFNAGYLEKQQQQ